MCYIVFISHWRYIKTALQEYVIKVFSVYMDRALALLGEISPLTARDLV